MAQYSILTLARQGDPRAIAYLITRTLQQYGIIARANRKGACLKLLLEGQQIPHQATMVRLVSQGMQKLNPPNLWTVELHGREKGQTRSAWQQVIQLSHVDPATLPVQFDLRTEPVEDPIFQLGDLDPDAVILVPVEPQVQVDDLAPDALVLVPIDPDQSLDSSSDLTEADDLALTGSVSDAGFPAGPLMTNPSAAVSPEAVRLPRRLTGVLLLALWIWCILHFLLLAYSLLSAGSVALYNGLDLANTNQPFASLLAVVIGIADFVFTPLNQFSPWSHVLVLLLSAWWLYRLHISLRQLLGSYPISPTGAMLRLLLPVYNIWGIGSVNFTLAHQLAVRASLNRASQRIRRLTLWLYLFLFGLLGLIGSHLWLLYTLTSPVTSLWFYVARDAMVWLLSLVWLRLVQVIWRALRTLYQAWVLPLKPEKRSAPRPAAAISLSALLLGAGASFLSLLVFNCLLGLIAVSVFVSNGVQPESLFSTFSSSESLLILVLVGSTVCIGLGGFVTAALARRAGLLHALGLGALLTAIGIGLQRSNLITALSDLPFWFQTASVAIMIPATLVGAGLRQWVRTL